MDLQLYPYQQECIDHAKKRNTIIHIPTGRGKTLIAARLIDHYLNCRPDQKIAFLVPTRALVEQQSTYLKKHCRVSGLSPAIQRFVGEEQAGWLESDWRECMKSNIFVGTAALFQQVFVTHKYIDICRFSLFVFDECHNATGNSPMAAVLRDSVAPYYKAHGLGSFLRILGLTASFDNGNSQNLEKKKRDLEALMQSTIFCPNVTARIVDERFHFVKWQRSEDVDHHKQAIQDHVQVALLSVAEIKDIKKVVNRCSHVFEELGTWALFYYIEFVIIDQLLTKAKLHAERVQDEPSLRHSARIQNSLPALRSELNTLSGKLERDPVLQPTARKSKKLQRLIELIEEIFDKNGDFYRGIVFVEQVALISTLTRQLNDEFQSSRRLIFGAVAGTVYQTETDRQNQLEKFKSGELHVLVSSAALEEGIDVSECGFVIRYTSIVTTKAHIQGSGRARHPNAVVYYFENNPVQEQQKEAHMTATAKDKSLSLSSDELKKASLSMSTTVTPRHHIRLRH